MKPWSPLLLLLASLGFAAQDAASLRLVPFPKEVRLEQGTFSLDRPLVVESAPGVADLLGRMAGAECKRTGCPAPTTKANEALTHTLRLGPEPA